MISRRDFVARAAGGLGVVLAGKSALAQQAKGDTGVVRDSTNLFAMDQMASRPVRLPPKPNATPLLTVSERDELEHHIRCQCGCTLDVFTCRTTDFSCQVSPAMHRDIMALVKGGYSAQEIINAFVNTYGERALMAPRKSGFNLIAWFAPGTAVALGAVGLAVMLRRWRVRPNARVAKRPALDVDATPEELAQLEAAVRGDGDSI